MQCWKISQNIMNSTCFFSDILSVQPWIMLLWTYISWGWTGCLPSYEDIQKWRHLQAWWGGSEPRWLALARASTPLEMTWFYQERGGEDVVIIITSRCDRSLLHEWTCWVLKTLYCRAMRNIAQQYLALYGQDTDSTFCLLLKSLLALNQFKLRKMEVKTGRNRYTWEYVCSFVWVTWGTGFKQCTHPSHTRWKVKSSNSGPLCNKSFCVDIHTIKKEQFSMIAPL